MKSAALRPPSVKTTLSLTPETAEVLRSLANDRGTSFTEVVRRAIALEKYLSDAKQAGGRVLVEEPDKVIKELVFLDQRTDPIAPDPLIRPVRIEFLGVGHCLSRSLAADPSLIHRLTPSEFEEFVCERLDAMGFEPRRVGATFDADGGIDIIFWPRKPSAFPFLGAAQVKHHRNPRKVEGPASARELVGSISGRPFSAGVVVTNTTFSPSAEWFARQHQGLVRLRGFADIKRWLADNFNGDEEWRELPSTIELAPGVVVKVR